MNHYANRGGNSNVLSYEIGNDFVAVNFKGTSKTYVYSYRSAGSNNVETMKQLAENGSGLNSYIMLNVKDKFER